jgi:hypothetical protein
MVDSKVLADRIHGLSDKQACHIVKSLTQDIISQMPSAPSFEEIGSKVADLSAETDTQLDLDATAEWYAVELTADDSGPAARQVLSTLAEQAGFDDLIDQAIDRYVDETLDLGIISVGVAIALVYLATSVDLDIDLDWFKLKKKGLSGSEQKEVVVKTLPQFAKAFVGSV